MKKELGLFTLLIVLCLTVCGIQFAKNSSELPRFLSAENLLNNANLIGMFGIFSIGMGMVIITGGIDLSVGSMCALAGVVLSIALKEWHWAWPLVPPRIHPAGADVLLGCRARISHHAHADATVHCHPVRVVDLPRHGALYCR